MIFEAWEFRRRLKYLDEWREVLKEKDDDRLKQMLQEIIYIGVVKQNMPLLKLCLKLCSASHAPNMGYLV